MSFEWDDAKCESNLLKHGVDFRRAVQMFENDGFIERPDLRRSYGETRIRCTGQIDGRVYVVIYTWRGSNKRIISARKANGREIRAYHASNGGRGPAAP